MNGRASWMIAKQSRNTISSVGGNTSRRSAYRRDGSSRPRVPGRPGREHAAARAMPYPTGPGLGFSVINEVQRDGCTRDDSEVVDEVADAIVHGCDVGGLRDHDHRDVSAFSPPLRGSARARSCVDVDGAVSKDLVEMRRSISCVEVDGPFGLGAGWELGQ